MNTKAEQTVLLSFLLLPSRHFVFLQIDISAQARDTYSLQATSISTLKRSLESYPGEKKQIFHLIPHFQENTVALIVSPCRRWIVVHCWRWWTYEAFRLFAVMQDHIPQQRTQWRAPRRPGVRGGCTCQPQTKILFDYMNAPPS